MFKLGAAAPRAGAGAAAPRARGLSRCPGTLEPVQVDIDSGGIRLRGHLARPPDAGSGHALVLAHGFPAGPRGAAGTGHTYPQLADRLAAESGWHVLCFNFRGTGDSEGDFSLGGWLSDLRAVTDHVLSFPGISSAWLCGFSTGGSLSLCAAGEDERVAGAASFAAPADFESWANDAEAFLARSRELGVVRKHRFPEDLDAWKRELHEIRPLALVAKIPPRPLLIVHGSDDELVPVVDARALADAAEGGAELRILSGAGHRLRHDPRAVAVLLGWIERQGA